ncbi:hypothetical protein BDR03DRAFT_957096 [Suillus americanus]|nr:hypothetical protein BDR03DRAFT_957096 [Suillus americanus]
MFPNQVRIQVQASQHPHTLVHGADIELMRAVVCVCLCLQSRGTVPTARAPASCLRSLPGSSRYWPTSWMHR